MEVLETVRCLLYSIPSSPSSFYGISSDLTPAILFLLGSTNFRLSFFCSSYSVLVPRLKILLFICAEYIGETRAFNRKSGASHFGISLAWAIGLVELSLVQCGHWQRERLIQYFGIAGCGAWSFGVLLVCMYIIQYLLVGGGWKEDGCIRGI